MIVVVGHSALLNDRLPTYIAVWREAGYLVEDVRHVLLNEPQAAWLRHQVDPIGTTSFAVDQPVCALELSFDSPKNTVSSALPMTAYSVFDTLRSQMDDVYASKDVWFTLHDQSLFFPQEKVLERGIIALRPKYSAELFQALHQDLYREQFVVLSKTARVLSETEASLLCGIHATAEELQLWTSDATYLVAVESLGVIQKAQLLVGPSSSRHLCPGTLNARADATGMALYASASELQAERDLSMFFDAPFELDHSVLIVRPEAIQHSHQILQLLNQQGFTVIAQRVHTISRVEAERVYKQHKSLAYYTDLVLSMGDGPSLLLLVAKPAAMIHLNILVGATQYEHYDDTDSVSHLSAESWQAQFGTHVLSPGVYTSVDDSSKRQDLTTFFPNAKDLQLSIPDTDTSISGSLNLQLQPGSKLQNVLVDGLTALCKAKPGADEAVAWLAQWLLNHNPNKPKIVSPPEEVVRVKPNVRSIWLLSRDESKQENISAVRNTAIAAGYEILDVTTLIEQAAKNDAEFGPTLYVEYINKARKTANVPTSVLVAILERAIYSTASSRLLINGFPFRLETALEMEKRVGRPAVVLDLGYANCERKQIRSDEEQSVINHYTLFNCFSQNAEASKIFK